MVSTNSVTQPQCAYGAVDSVLQQLHRRCVTQPMGRETLLPQRWTGGPCHCQIPGHHVGEPVVAECVAALIGENKLGDYSVLSEWLSY